MKKRKFIALVAGVSLVLILLALPLMAACKAAETPTGPGVPTVPTAPGEEEEEEMEQIVWRHSWYGISRDFTKAQEWFAQRLFERTDGKWKIDFYWGAILCPSTRTNFCIRDGLIEVANGLAGAETPYGNFAPMTNYFVPPRSDADQALWGFEGAHHPNVIAELAKYNARPWVVTACGARSMWSQRPIDTAEDLDGLIMHDSGAGLGKKMWEAFGGKVEEIAYADVPEMATRGVINAAYSEFLICTGDPWRWHEVFAYVGDHKGRSPVKWASKLCNLDAWNALPEEFKDIFYDVAYNEYPALVTQYQDQLETRWLPRFEEYGKCTVSHQTDEAWTFPLLKVAREEVWPVLIKDLEDRGLDGKGWFKYTVDLAAKYGRPWPAEEYVGTLDDFLASL